VPHSPLPGWGNVVLSEAIRPEFVIIDDELRAPMSVYLPARTALRSAVIVLPGPGEPRGGYARIFRELASQLARSAIGTVVVELDTRPDDGMTSRWRQCAAAAARFVRDRQLEVALWVARGASWVALEDMSDAPVALINPGPGWDAGERSTAEQLTIGGFEEVCEGAGLAERVLDIVARCGATRPDNVMVITHARQNAAPVNNRVLRPPGPVNDPLFRRVWERPWLVSTLVGMVGHG
jgi:hypothetical protein